MKYRCICCGLHNHKVIWNDKIRVGKNIFSRNRKKVIACSCCGLVSLEKKIRILENSSIARNLYNNNNSIKEFIKFHYPREIKKIKFIEKYVNLKNKKVLESNCGSGILINYLKKKSSHTSGLDNRLYGNFIKKNGHFFYSSINEILAKKVKFDAILSLSELEHKINPILFLKNLKKLLSGNGKLILRVPNYNNIYKFLLGYDFLKYDFRNSHNYYFSEKNLDIIFSKLNFKIIEKVGMNEYSFNHLLTYVRNKKRVNNKGVLNFFEKKKDQNLVTNIEKNMISTSLLYILSK